MQGLARHLSFCPARKALADTAEKETSAATNNNTDSVETPSAEPALGSSVPSVPAESDNVFEPIPVPVTTTGSEVVDTNVSFKVGTHKFVIVHY